MLHSLPLEFPAASKFLQVYPAAWHAGTLAQPGQLFREPGGKVLLCVRRGKGNLLAEGTPREYGPDFVCAVGDASRLVFAPETATDVLCLRLKQAGRLLEEPPPPVWDPAIVRRMAVLYQEAQEGLPGDIYTASAQVYGLLMELCRAGAGERAAYSELVRDAMGILREEYAYLSGVDELAQRLEVSKAHLVRSFSAQVGKGPGRYLQEVRMEQARMILASGEYPVELVAGMTGYSCANYFCKVFRREYGMSPGRYREQHRAAVTPPVRSLEELMVL